MQKKWERKIKKIEGVYADYLVSGRKDAADPVSEKPGEDSSPATTIFDELEQVDQSPALSEQGSAHKQVFFNAKL